MWHKGMEVLREYPELEGGTTGEGGRPSYRQIARETGRANHTIKRWVDLVGKVGKTEDALERWI